MVEGSEGEQGELRRRSTSHENRHRVVLAQRLGELRIV